MNEIIEKTLLYDFYGELLTKNQKQIYELYHLNDLSLGEISEQLDISRQGVHDTLKRCDKQLSNYEDKLQLVNKFIKNKDNINQIFQYTNEILNATIDKETVINKIQEIQSICKDILEDL